MNQNRNHDEENTTFQCQKCGKCCIKFSGQIRYQINKVEENWRALDPVYREFIQEFNRKKPIKYCYPLRISRIKRIRNEISDFYLIPTKLEFLAMILSSDYRDHKIDSEDASSYFAALVEFSSTSLSKECLFLTHKGNYKICSINNTHPKMCDEYPRNKGYVCINQRERYFSQEYLKFKKKAFTDEVSLLNRFIPYFREHDLEYTWDIIAFLMDFGKFPIEKLEAFFTDLGWKSLDFKYAVKDLRRYGLIFSTLNNEKEEMVESISSTLLKRKFKNLMKSTEVD